MVVGAAEEQDGPDSGSGTPVSSINKCKSTPHFPKVLAASPSDSEVSCGSVSCMAHMVPVHVPPISNVLPVHAILSKMPPGMPSLTTPSANGALLMCTGLCDPIPVSLTKKSLQRRSALLTWQLTGS